MRRWSEYQRHLQEGNRVLRHVVYKNGQDIPKRNWFYDESYQDILKETQRRWREENPLPPEPPAPPIGDIDNNWVDPHMSSFAA